MNVFPIAAERAVTDESGRLGCFSRFCVLFPSCLVGISVFCTSCLYVCVCFFLSQVALLYTSLSCVSLSRLRFPLTPLSHLAEFTSPISSKRVIFLFVFYCLLSILRKCFSHARYRPATIVSAPPYLPLTTTLLAIITRNRWLRAETIPTCGSPTCDPLPSSGFPIV